MNRHTDFKPITLSDKAWMQSLFELSGYQAVEYNFDYCYIWQEALECRVARLDDLLLLKAGGPEPAYMFPPGRGDLSAALDLLCDDAVMDGQPMRLFAVLPDQMRQLEQLRPGFFDFAAMRQDFDYIYEAEKLIHLPGGHLHSKRNHIHRFKENYPDWRYEPISAGNIEEVKAMYQDWLTLNAERIAGSPWDETVAVGFALNDFAQLDMVGGLIRADGRIMAFSVGSRLNADTYMIHLEKAYGDIQGAYAIINQEFAAHNCRDYRFINREDDLGLPGLRKAKLSYHPFGLLEKYIASQKLSAC
ncbi:MAG: phosphatidylglycerol lysyltransferase domain-containing protein [Deltaproteobacteria bacterium]|jgi:hypothetical protein|nr:phosphatidylglycerol lysyltransferase domain-containing protein [Deltaproteobacteria bacterium]